MLLVVVSHKSCWPSSASPTGYATDGGFPLQMRALSELFDETRIVVPCERTRQPAGERAITGRNVTVVPLTPLRARDGARKARLPIWTLRNLGTLVREIRGADAAHTPIPGDVGTIGMLVALACRKPLFVRHCGNWNVHTTTAERFWGWIMQRAAGGRNVMLATGGADAPPSANPANRWIFSTSLTEREIEMLDVPRAAPRPGSVRLVIACRQDAPKGTGVVIESLPLVRRTIPGATLEVVGDGPDLAVFKTLATRCGVESCVRFHGAVGHERVLDLLRQADLFCYPTAASDGFPKAVLEALACGLPVIATPVSVLPVLLRDGAGRLISAPTPGALAAAVIDCLSDARTYIEMSRRARETARRYSLERWQQELRALLSAAWGPLQSHA